MRSYSVTAGSLPLLPTSACEMALKELDRCQHGVRCRCRVGLELLPGARGRIEAMRRPVIDSHFDLATNLPAPRDQRDTAISRDLFVGRAVENQYWRIRQERLRIEATPQAASRVECKRGAEAGSLHARRNAVRFLRHGCDRGAATVGPSLQAYAVENDVMPRLQVGQRMLCVEGSCRDLVELLRTTIVGEPRKALRISVASFKVTR